jgi:hypothetical protein
MEAHGPCWCGMTVMVLYCGQPKRGRFEVDRDVLETSNEDGSVAKGNPQLLLGKSANVMRGEHAKNTYKCWLTQWRGSRRARCSGLQKMIP